MRDTRKPAIMQRHEIFTRTGIKVQEGRKNSNGLKKKTLKEKIARKILERYENQEGVYRRRNFFNQRCYGFIESVLYKSQINKRNKFELKYPDYLRLGFPSDLEQTIFTKKYEEPDITNTLS